MKFAEGMEELDAEQTERIFDRIGTAAQGLFYLPYVSLKKTCKHEFGCLRLWPKLKSFKEEKNIDDYKWRPLVSYRKHKWRKLLSLLSKF